LLDSNAILEHLTMHLQITVFTTLVCPIAVLSSVNHESLSWTSCTKYPIYQTVASMHVIKRMEHNTAISTDLVQLGMRVQLRQVQVYEHVWHVTLKVMLACGNHFHNCTSSLQQTSSETPRQSSGGS